jgi:hypothetical protein
MIINLWDEVQMEAKDYADDIIQKLNILDEVRFEPNYDTSKGLKLFPDTTVLPNNGIHCIYRKGVPLYVGYSGNSTRERLGKFCAAVRSTLRDDEWHVGGTRYLKLFGEDFDDVTVKAVEYYAGQDISVKLSEITEEIAVKMNCILNDVIYKQNNPEDTSSEQSLWT